MAKKILVGLVLVIGAFLTFVSTRDGHFKYERSGVINAPQEKIFPYISNLKKGAEWSPYEKMDPNMTKSFEGTDGLAGSKMTFDSKDAGSGHIEILGMTPNENVQLKLVMTKPFHAENLIEYKLTPDAGGTRFSWAMSGDGGFMGKLMTVLIDCEKMVAGQFEEGIANLKQVVESQQVAEGKK